MRVKLALLSSYKRIKSFLRILKHNFYNHRVIQIIIFVISIKMTYSISIINVTIFHYFLLFQI